MGIGKHFWQSSEKTKQPKIDCDFQKITRRQFQCSSSSQIPSKDNRNNSNQFLSLYDIIGEYSGTYLHIYDTVNRKKVVKCLDAIMFYVRYTSITQLPNGELFCHSDCYNCITFIIDKNYRVRILPSETYCLYNSALYCNNNIYFFGGYSYYGGLCAQSRKFNLERCRWEYLPSLPEKDDYCNSVIFNRNILISGYRSRNLWLYSSEIDSFSIISCEFASKKIKLLINVDSLYLIEWDSIALIYESKDGHDWWKVSEQGSLVSSCQTYCLYNKEKIYISAGGYNYYQFDLKKKTLSELKVKIIDDPFHLF